MFISLPKKSRLWLDGREHRWRVVMEPLAETESYQQTDTKCSYHCISGEGRHLGRFNNSARVHSASSRLISASM